MSVTGTDAGAGVGRIPRDWAAGLVLAAVAAAVINAPWLLSDRVAAVGSPDTEQVVRLNIWTLDTWWLIFQGAPLDVQRIFAPEAGSLFFSEPQFLQGAVAALFRATGSGPVRAYNAVFLIWQILNFLAVWIFTGALLRRRWPGLKQAGRIGVKTLTSCLVAWNPCLVREMGVLQLWSLWPFVITFSALCLQSPNWRSAVCIAAGTAATAHSCLYYFAALVLIAGPLTVLRLWRNRGLKPRGRLGMALWAGGSLAVGCLCLLPIALPMTALHERLGFSRDPFEAWSGALRLGEMLKPSQVLSVWSGDHPWTRFDPGRSWGYGYMILIGLGLAAAFRSGDRRLLLLAAAPAAIGLLLALGPGYAAAAGGRTWSPWPYDFINGFTPLLHSIRSPYRFATLAMLMAAPLFVHGVHHAWIHARSFGGLSKWAILSLASLLLLEAVPATGRAYAFTPERREVWMAVRAQGLKRLWFAREEAPEFSWESSADSQLMLEQSCWHGPPMINGYSGYAPGYVAALQNFSGDAESVLMTLNFLEADGMILPGASELSPERRRLLEDFGWTPLISSDGSTLFTRNSVHGPEGGTGPPPETGFFFYSEETESGPVVLAVPRFTSGSQSKSGGGGATATAAAGFPAGSVAVTFNWTHSDTGTLALSSATTIARTGQPQRIRLDIPPDGAYTLTAAGTGVNAGAIHVRVCQQWPFILHENK